jgi:transcriptional regulator with XRE-family HTH domain
MDINITLGKRLSSIRESQSMTLEQAASLINISITDLFRIEDDEAQPNVVVLANMSKVYQRTTDYLLGLNNTILQKPLYDLCVTLSGKVVKVGVSEHHTFAFEISENVLASIRLEENSIHFLAKNNQEIYHSLGWVTFESVKPGHLTGRFSGPGIESVLIGENTTPISNPLTAVQDVIVNFSGEQIQKWVWR